MSIKSVSKIMTAIANADTSFTWESDDAYKVAKKFIDLVEDCSPNVVLDILESNVPNDDYETFDDPEKDAYYEDEDDYDEDEANEVYDRVVTPLRSTVVVPVKLMRRLREEYDANNFYLYENPNGDETSFFILPEKTALDDETKKILNSSKLKYRKFHACGPLTDFFTFSTKKTNNQILDTVYIKKAAKEAFFDNELPYTAAFSWDDDVWGIRVDFFA